LSRNGGRASVGQEPLWDETTVDKTTSATPAEAQGLVRGVLDRDNLVRALRRVISNKGSPGVDGMDVRALPAYLKRHWPRLRSELLAGRYQPQPVKRVEIDKAGGGKRKLGVPIVVDRFIQQALLQVLQPIFEPGFSESSFGFRPGRSAHQAVSRAQGFVAEGYRWVVDLDLEKFFDRVNHDLLMGRLAKRIRDPQILRLICRYLRAGVLERGLVSPSEEGTPQGGPLSPLLSNVLLTDLDRELERRGHRFVRYADDANIYVKSERAGQRVRASLTRFLEVRLKLKVNEAKSAVAPPWQRKFLGFSFIARRPHRRRVALAPLERFKAEVRRLTGRTRGVSLARLIEELKRYLIGWQAYFGFAEVQTLFRELDKWICRRLRCYLWKQWGRRRYRELTARGVSRDLAWNTVKSAHGPWRLSASPALSIALPTAYFRALGVPPLC
jgi:RNA-directed DNA polymerase